MTKSLPNSSVLTTEVLFSSSGHYRNILEHNKFVFSVGETKYFEYLQYPTVYIALFSNPYKAPDSIFR